MTPPLEKLDTMPVSKAKLLRVTMELMADKGFESMGIQEMLQAADVSKSNFYYHFKSKEALCLETLDLMTENFYYQIVQNTLAHPELTPRQRLESFFQCLYQVLDECCCKRGCAFVNLATETSDFFPEFRLRLNAHFERLRQTFATCYQNGVTVGEFRSDLDLVTVSRFIMSLVNGSMVLAKAGKSAQVCLDNWTILETLLSTA